MKNVRYNNYDKKLEEYIHKGYVSSLIIGGGGGSGPPGPLVPTPLHTYTHFEKRGAEPPVILDAGARHKVTPRFEFIVYRHRPL